MLNSVRRIVRTVNANGAQSVFKASLVYQDKNQEASPPLAFYNAPCVIRTHDRLLRRQLLYPAELREQFANIASGRLRLLGCWELNYGGRPSR